MEVSACFMSRLKTNDIDATVRFYTEVLGMKLARPAELSASPAPGLRSATARPSQHLRRLRLGAEGKTALGTTALDHVSLSIKGWDECLERIKKLGFDWRASVVPGMSLWQIFVHDPSGVMLELTFDGKVENRPCLRFRPGASTWRGSIRRAESQGA